MPDIFDQMHDDVQFESALQALAQAADPVQFDLFLAHQLRTIYQQQSEMCKRQDAQETRLNDHGRSLKTLIENQQPIIKLKLGWSAKTISIVGGIATLIVGLILAIAKIIDYLKIGSTPPVR